VNIGLLRPSAAAAAFCIASQPVDPVSCRSYIDLIPVTDPNVMLFAIDLDRLDLRYHLRATTHHLSISNRFVDQADGHLVGRFHFPLGRTIRKNDMVAVRGGERVSGKSGIGCGVYILRVGSTGA